MGRSKVRPSIVRCVSFGGNVCSLDSVSEKAEWSRMSGKKSNGSLKLSAGGWELRFFCEPE